MRPPPALICCLLAPCRCWSLYFDYESEFAGWQQLYSAAAAEALQQGEAGAAAREQQAALAEQTLPLLQAMLEFLQQRSLDSLVGAAGSGGGDPMSGAAGEVAVVVGPDAGAETAAEVQQGAAFPAYASPEEQQAEAEALRAALAAAAAGLLPAEEQQQLAVAAGPAPEDMPGMVTGALAGAATASRQSCALLLDYHTNCCGLSHACEGSGRPPQPAVFLIFLCLFWLACLAAVAVECGSPAALEAAALLLAQALKGSLPAAAAEPPTAAAAAGGDGAEASVAPLVVSRRATFCFPASSGGISACPPSRLPPGP